MAQHAPTKDTQAGERLEVGGHFAPRSLQAVGGKSIDIPSAVGLVHLQLRRFAGCPICNTHLRSIVRRHDEIAAAGIQEVAVFHSSAQELAAYGDFPFAIVGDPERRLYRELGAEPSLQAVLHPRVWGAALQGLFQRRPGLLSVTKGGPLGLPADFLISPEGRVLALKYGTHAYDQWSVDELLAVARASS
jgi:hypothetical protein